VINQLKFNQSPATSKRFHPLPPIHFSLSQSLLSSSHCVDGPQNTSQEIGHQATGQGGSEEGAEGALRETAEDTGSEDVAERLDRKKVAGRLPATQVVDGGAEGTAGGGAGEQDDGGACVAEGRVGRVCRCDRREPME
jgi:hypothetical protein